MVFPLGLSELTLLFAATALILFFTSEVLSEYYGKINIFISKKRVRNAAVIFSILFMASLAVRLIGILTT
jgi:hypothetical protein